MFRIVCSWSLPLPVCILLTRYNYCWTQRTMTYTCRSVFILYLHCFTLKIHYFTKINASEQPSVFLTSFFSHFLLYNQRDRQATTVTSISGQQCSLQTELLENNENRTIRRASLQVRLGIDCTVTKDIVKIYGLWFYQTLQLHQTAAPVKLWQRTVMFISILKTRYSI